MNQAESKVDDASPPGHAIERHEPRRSVVARLLIGLALVGALVAGLVLSCRRKKEDLADRRPELRGVPVIRVCLTAGPVPAAILSATGGYRLLAGGRIISESNGPLPPTVFRRTGQGWTFDGSTVVGGEVELETTGGGHVRFGQVAYRGKLRLLPAGTTDLIAVNHVDMEGYLAGVLPKELYGFWLAETYRALAVAARTFALYHMRTTGRSRRYDLGADQASQVYGGFTAETAKSRAAVAGTRGLVLTWGPDGDERIFMAQYSACCGGTVNGANVIRDPPDPDIPPLAGGQECLHCTGCSRYRWPPVRVPKADLYLALQGCYGRAVAAARVTAADRIRVVSHTPYGRAVWVDVADRAGRSIRIRAEDIRLALIRAKTPAARGLYSMNCSIRDLGGSFEFYDGRGFGHGVGLCQWGAQGKAAAGWSAERILGFYYPGAKLFRAY